MNLISLFIVSIFSGNIVLTKFLGMCSFFGTSNKRKNAIYMGISVTIVTVLSSIITYFVNKYLLIPTNTTYFYFDNFCFGTNNSNYSKKIF